MTGSIPAGRSQASKFKVPSRAGSQRFPAIEFFFRFAAAPAVIIYAMLFLAYRNYYTRLGIDPEDVGVDNAYILSRSLGFVIIVALVVLCAVVTIAVDSLNTPDTWFGVLQTGGIALVKVVLALPLGFFLYQVISPELNPQLRALISFFALTPQMIVISKLRKVSRWAEFSVYLLLVALGVGITTIVLVTRSHYMADQVLRGVPAAAVEYVSVPVLDFESPTVDISWTGPKEQRPVFFSPTGVLSGHLVGHGANADYILVSQLGKPVLIRVPTATTATRVILSVPVSLNN